MRSRVTGRQPRTHIVRVYRLTAQGVVGQVEDVRSGLVRPFRTAAELWRAVRGSRLDVPKKTDAR